MATPTTAHQAARAIATWLQRHPRTGHPDIAVGVDRTKPGAIVIHDPAGCRDYIGYDAEAGVAFEGGPENWTSVGTHPHWDGVTEAAHRGEIDMGPFWAEAANGWSVLIYRS